MKANELRIGNWVMGNAPFKVDGMQISLAEAREREGFEIGWQPIAITEDFLRDIGFDIQVDEDEDGIVLISTKGRRGDFDYDVVLYSSDDSEFHGCDIRGVFADLFRVKYVHQLQNLYFVLTGEELTFKTVEK